MTRVPHAPAWDRLASDLDALHQAALAAADPVAAVSAALGGGEDGYSALTTEALGREGPIRLIAAGKAALGMAAAAIDALGSRIVDGVVVHPRAAVSADEETKPWPIALRRHAAGHPLPDEGSLAAGEAALEVAAAAAKSRDVLLVLLSGGASALMELPLPGVSLAELREVTRALQHSGADINDLNAVRRSLSRLKGGGLARLAAPARVVTLALSDVVGDPPEAIGSGPTVASSTDAEQALAILDRRGIGGVPAVQAALRAAPPKAQEPPPGLFRVIASNRLAAEAVLRAATARGFHSQITSTRLQGEAREVGLVIGGCAASVRSDGLPLVAPACLVFGGETTVTVRGKGCGGRNQELALGAAQAIAGFRHTAVLSFATDGVDGTSLAAGALATGETLARATALGHSAHSALAANDSEAYFRALGDLWSTGPSGTNVNDLAIALVYP